MDDKLMVPYAVVIPTRGRREQLIETLQAVAKSTTQPKLVVVVDNNDSQMEPLPVFGDWAQIHYFPPVGNGVPRGDAQGSADGMAWAKRMGYHVAVKWDDDLVPEPTCIPKLVYSVSTGVAPAAGGMYPRADVPANRQCHMNPDHTVFVPDGNPRHLQFFGWNGQAAMLPVRHLYSSFAYDVGKAEVVGGFCRGYSQLAYRHETDFTLRMWKRWGSLAVDTSAVASHKLAGGGVRSFGEAEYHALARADKALFMERMLERGISPEF